MTKVVLFGAAIEHLLRDPEGMVAKDLRRRAINVENQAKIYASGTTVPGAPNPEGRGPNVQTGRLRSSITHEIRETPDGLVARIGSNVEYAAYVEQGTDRAPAYPYLLPALEAARL